MALLFSVLVNLGVGLSWLASVVYLFAVGAWDIGLIVLIGGLCFYRLLWRSAMRDVRRPPSPID